MSFVYDVMSAVWANKIRPLVQDEELAFRFEMLIEAMHSANHRVPSADGTFRGDGINHDASVTKMARALQGYAEGRTDD